MNIPLTYLATVQAEEVYIQQDHEADISNGLNESEASESDAFERRVLGLEEEDDYLDETSVSKPGHLGYRGWEAGSIL